MTLLRLYKILTTFKAYQIEKILPEHTYSKRILLLSKLLFWVKPKQKEASDGERLRLCLQELGPIWVKFGQMLSTRHDLLPAQIASALAQLHDQVQPFDGKIAQSIIEKSLPHKFDTIFKEFDPKPLASASIAQVHTATLIKGSIPVVIKVLRPNIEETIHKDIKLMFWLAERFEKWNREAKRYHLKEVVQDYKTTIFNELNLLREADNTLKLRDNFIQSQILYVPYIYKELSSKEILVEERVFGVPISHIDELKRQGVNLKLLAERGVTIFFKQVFEDNFFHADMHPGNIFINTSNPIDPYYIGIDCAIIGSLTEDDQHFLAEIFMGFFNQDYQKIAKLYIDSGWVGPNTDSYQLESSIQEVCEPIFQKPLGELSFAQVLIQLFNVARQFEIQIQPQLILLQKTLFYIEGLGRQLYPQLDLWQTAKPFLENWNKKQRSIKTIRNQIQTQIPEWRQLLLNLPQETRVLKRSNKALQYHLQELDKKLSDVNRRSKVSNIINIVLLCAVMIMIGLKF